MLGVTGTSTREAEEEHSGLSIVYMSCRRGRIADARGIVLDTGDLNTTTRQRSGS